LPHDLPLTISCTLAGGNFHPRVNPGRSQGQFPRIVRNVLNSRRKSGRRGSGAGLAPGSLQEEVETTQIPALLFYFCSSTVAGDPGGRAPNRDQAACKPGSVRDAPVAPRDGHSSGTPVARRLARPTRTTGPETGPRRAGARRRRPYLVLLPVGFTVPPPLPAPRCALTAPFHPHPQAMPTRPGPGGQTALCGTFPGVAPAGRYPAPCFRGARTFLSRVASRATIRPPDPDQMSDRGAPASSALSAARTPSSRARVPASGSPSTRSGRKCRWKAAITHPVA
jgi:hypothetical protein